MKHLLFMLAIATGACVTEPDKPLPPQQQPGDTDPGSDDDGLLLDDPDLAPPPPTTPGDGSCHLRSKTVDCPP